MRFEILHLHLIRIHYHYYDFGSLNFRVRISIPMLSSRMIMNPSSVCVDDGNEVYY